MTRRLGLLLCANLLGVTGAACDTTTPAESAPAPSTPTSTTPAVTKGHDVASHQRVHFVKGSLKAALAKAKKEKKNLMVEVWATWCPPCRVQQHEIFDTQLGANLSKNLVSWRVDFDSPAGKAFTAKRNILTLPTVLFLYNDGVEIGRIESYRGKQNFMQHARELAAGSDPLPKMLADLVKLKGATKLEAQKKRAQLQVLVGQRKLVRGETDVGTNLLDTALAWAKAHHDEVGAGALYVKGRYFSRAKRDFKKALPVWKELLDAFPASHYDATAAYWYAGALHELGQDDATRTFFRNRCGKIPSFDCAGLFASFAKMTPGFDALAHEFISKADLNAEQRKELLDELKPASSTEPERE